MSQHARELVLPGGANPEPGRYVAKKYSAADGAVVVVVENARGNTGPAVANVLNLEREIRNAFEEPGARVLIHDSNGYSEINSEGHAVRTWAPQEIKQLTPLAV